MKKLDLLKEFSDPAEVARRAKQIYDIQVYPSNRTDKKYMILDGN